MIIPSTPSRVHDVSSLLDLVDRRVDELIVKIKALPYEDRKDSVTDIIENLDRNRRACGHSANDIPEDVIPPGLSQVVDLMLMLNYVGVDCELGEPYPEGR